MRVTCWRRVAAWLAALCACVRTHVVLLYVRMYCCTAVPPLSLLRTTVVVINIKIILKIIKIQHHHSRLVLFLHYQYDGSPQ